MYVCIYIYVYVLWFLLSVIEIVVFKETSSAFALGQNWWPGSPTGDQLIGGSFNGFSQHLGVPIVMGVPQELDGLWWKIT